MTRRYYGTGYNDKNRYFSELPPEERKRYYQELVSAMAQGARPVSDLVTKFDAYPGLEQYTLTIDNYSVVDGDYSYFDLPFSAELFHPGSDRRALPLFISRKSAQTLHTEIELPPAFRQVVIAPRSEKLKGPGGCGSARITSACKDGKCSLTHQFEANPAIVSPRDYPALLRIESALGRKSSRVFLLEKSTAAAPGAKAGT